MATPTTTNDGDLRIPKNLVPWLVGFLLGGGGTFGVTSLTQERQLSQTDLEKIGAVVEKAVSQSQELMRTERRLDIQEAIRAHETAHHGTR